MPEETQLTLREAAEMQPAEPPRNMMSAIAAAAANPQVDAAKMRELWALHKEMLQDHRKQVFFSALTRMQARIPQITKDGRIVVQGQERSRYAKVETIDHHIRPLMHEFGFAVSWDEEKAEGKNRTYVGRLSHEDGHEEPYRITLPMDESGSKNGCQSVGATESYAHRYLLCKMFNIVTVGTDTDANAMAPISDEQAKTIDTLLTDTKADRVAFLKWAGVDAIEKIPQRDYGKVLEGLNDKKREQARKAQK